jgi:hypothetical protein
MLSRVGARRVPPPPEPSVVGTVVHGFGSGGALHVGVGVDDRPAEPDEVSGDGGGDERFALAGLGVEPSPDVVQALLCFPGGRGHAGGLVLLAVLERRADFWRAVVVPGGFDQETAGVTRAGLRDRALAAGLAGAVLGGHPPDIAHQLLGVLEPREVLNLGAQSDRGQRVDPTQAPQLGDVPRLGRCRDELRDRRLERVAADHKRIDRAEIVKERRLRATLGQLDLREPLAVAPGPVIRRSRRSGRRCLTGASRAGAGRASSRRGRPPAREPHRAAPPPRHWEHGPGAGR